MNRIGISLLATWALVGSAAPASAHHSFAAEFDANTHGELTGTITQVWFNNPHVRYRLAVQSAQGAVEEWELQIASVTALQQLGWTRETLQAGNEVKVTGQLGRNGAKKLYVRSVERPDGTRLATGRGNAAAPDPNIVTADPDQQYGYGATGNDYPVDITGVWRNSYKFRVTVDDLTPKPTPLTAEGRKLLETTEYWHDAALRCLAPGLPRVFGSPYNMEIIDAGTHYLILHVDHTMPRRVWMDGRTAAATTPDTSLGFSVGRWEGDTLVIETTHLSAAWLDGSGLPMKGAGTRIVERWDVADDRLSIDRTMTIYDPYYTAPLVRVRGSARGNDIDISEQASCDPDSYYRDLRDSGRLDEHFGR